MMIKRATLSFLATAVLWSAHAAQAEAPLSQIHKDQEVFNSLIRQYYPGAEVLAGEASKNSYKDSWSRVFMIRGSNQPDKVCEGFIYFEEEQRPYTCRPDCNPGFVRFELDCTVMMMEEAKDVFTRTLRVINVPDAFKK